MPFCFIWSVYIWLNQVSITVLRIWFFVKHKLNLFPRNEQKESNVQHWWIINIVTIELQNRFIWELKWEFHIYFTFVMIIMHSWQRSVTKSWKNGNWQKNGFESMHWVEKKKIGDKIQDFTSSYSIFFPPRVILIFRLCFRFCHI